MSQAMLKADFISYKMVPIASYSDIALANDEIKREAGVVRVLLVQHVI